MKKTEILFSLAVCSVVLGATSTAFAADVVLPTEGSIQWVVPTGPGEVIKPELPEIIIKPGEGGSTSGPLKLQHVPDFDFGKQELKTGEQTFNPLLSSYTFTGDVVQPGGNKTDTYYIPHFIQVTDERGLKNGWDLKVSATKFTNGSDVLDNATITLHGTDKLSNSVHSDTEIKNRVTTFGANDLVISTDPNAPVLVMGTKDNTSATTTNGTKTSLVLDKTYNKDKLDYKATDVNKGVTFTKTKNDIAILGTYKSTINWTLTDGK